MNQLISDSSATAYFDGKLAEGEQLLWAGRPLSGRLPRGTTDYIIWGIVGALTVAIFVILHGYALLFVYQTSTELKLQILGFTLLPLGTALLITWSDIQKRKHAIYAVTDHRLILMNQLSGQFNQLPLAKLKGLRLKQKTNGRGTVMFAAPLSKAFSDSSSRNQGKNAPPNFTKGFMWIENSQQVHSLVEEAVRSASSN